MSSIFPLRDTVTNDDQRGPRLVDLDEETADEVFEALAAQTTRQIFLSLHEQPKTASDLADETETSVQNVQYHLEKLQGVDLVDAVDTWYSERGSEMSVYAPTDESLVLFAGQDKQRSIRSLFNRFVGIASILVPGSLLAGWAASQAGTEGGQPTVEDLTAEGEDVDAETVDAPDDDDVAAETDDEVTPEDDDVSIAAEEPEEEDADVAAEEPEEVDAETIGDSAEADTVEFDATGDTDVIVTAEETDAPVLITDGGNVTELPENALQGATDTTTIDPALAAGLAFFCGGLFVLVSLWAWYGMPGSQ